MRPRVGGCKAGNHDNDLELASRWRCQFWADCTTNISERKFPTGTGGRGGYLKKSLDRNTTGPLASTGPSKNLRDARSSIASRSRTN